MDDATPRNENYACKTNGWCTALAQTRVGGNGGVRVRARAYVWRACVGEAGVGLGGGCGGLGNSVRSAHAHSLHDRAVLQLQVRSSKQDIAKLLRLQRWHAPHQILLQENHLLRTQVLRECSRGAQKAPETVEGCHDVTRAQAVSLRAICAQHARW